MKIILFFLFSVVLIKKSFSQSSDYTLDLKKKIVIKKNNNDSLGFIIQIIVINKSNHKIYFIKNEENAIKNNVIFFTPYYQNNSWINERQNIDLSQPIINLTSRDSILKINGNDSISLFLEFKAAKKKNVKNVSFFWNQYFFSSLGAFNQLGSNNYLDRNSSFVKKLSTLLTIKKKKFRFISKFVYPSYSE